MKNDPNRHAQQLARIAMKLQRTPDKNRDALIYAAERCLTSYKMARMQASESFGEVISPEVGEGLEDTLQALANVIKDSLDPLGFALIAFSVEADGPRVNYVSNCVREDICEAMREFIVAHEREAAST